MEKKVTITIITSSEEDVTDETVLLKVQDGLAGFDWWGVDKYIDVKVETVVISEEEIAEWH